MKFIFPSTRFIPERHKVLGPDLATAHFLVKRGAKVKFINRNSWFKRDKQGHMYLPNQFVPGMHLEAIDATGMQMSYVAFDNMSEYVIILKKLASQFFFHEMHLGAFVIGATGMQISAIAFIEYIV